MQFSTKVIHSGQHADETTGAVIPPIYMTSTYAQTSPGEIKGYEYTRAGNPNFTALEALLAGLESAKYATVFASGLGATTALMSMLNPGDKVITMQGLYGGTYRLFNRYFAKYGIEFEFVPVNALLDALNAQAKVLFIETPNNPLLQIIDIQQVCARAKQLGIITIVDNTFATPALQNPITLGADVVLHSTTKYISGHSDVIGGAVMTNHQDIKEQLDFYRMAIGVNPSPFDTWLTLRGAKTLAVRMRQHCENARQLAEVLSSHPEVAKVYYPGLSTHPDHTIAKTQMSDFGGIVSVEYQFSAARTKQMISQYRYFTLAESLGGIESLVCHPASMTHASIPEAERLRSGLSDKLVRYSVGIESIDDLCQDILTGIERCK